MSPKEAFKCLGRCKGGIVIKAQLRLLLYRKTSPRCRTNTLLLIRLRQWDKPLHPILLSATKPVKAASISGWKKSQNIIKRKGRWLAMSTEKTHGIQKVARIINITNSKLGKKIIIWSTCRNFVAMEIANRNWQRLQSRLGLWMLMNENRSEWAQRHPNSRPGIFTIE